MAPQVFELSRLDRFLVPCFIRMILCFPLEPSAAPAVVENLQNSLSKLQVAVPWLAGSIRRASQPPNEIELVLDPSKKIPFIVKNIEDELPSYSDLAAQRMPVAALKERLISPVGIVPSPSKKEGPAFILQANFIRGGMLLTFAMHHSGMDGMSLGTLIDALGRLCSGQELSLQEIQAFSPIEDRKGRFQRTSRPSQDVTINGHPQYTIGDPVDPAIYEKWPEFLPEMPSMTAKMIHFTNASLAALKAACKPPTAESWISTTDALCALLWTSISRARHPPGSTAVAESKTSILTTPINIRGRASPPLPDSYLGNAFFDIVTPLPVDTLISAPLSAVAMSLRRSVTAVDSAYIQDTVNLFASASDISTIKPGGRDILITSWTEQPAYSAHFGDVLGKAEWVRTPYLAAADGVIISMPRTPHGQEVFVGISAANMERLRADQEFMRYVDYVTD